MPPLENTFGKRYKSAGASGSQEANTDTKSQ
jgi:hypothetical protein